MTIIQYTEPKRYLFAERMLELCDSLGSQIRRNPAQYELTVEDEFLAQLLERINHGQKAVVVPNLKASRVLVTAPDRRQLEQACQRIRHFLVPTYAFLEQKLKPKKFDGKHALQQLGAELYPAGYYVLQSRKEFEDQVLYFLGLWMDLEESYPQREHHDEIPTYGHFYERFRMALATAQWSEAEQVRLTMLLYNLTSAENLLFLEIEQLSLQRRWSEIWRRRERAQLVQARVPRSVRGALLTAFHQTVLLPFEQQGQWQEALEAFREQIPLLGTLLTGRLGLAEGPVVQVFAYQAMVERDRATLLELMDVNSNTEVQQCIESLLALLASEISPTVPAKQVERTALEKARDALNYGDFDAARRYSWEVREDDTRAVLLMQIAFHTVDIALAEEALSAYSKLSTSGQQHVIQRYPFITHIQSALQKLAGEFERVPAEIAVLQHVSIENWLVWFDEIKRSSIPHSEMSQAVSRLAESCDERFWTATQIGRFTEVLLDIIYDEQLIKKDLVRDALLKIAQFFLSESEFPRTDLSVYRDLYETLYLAFLEMPKELQYTGLLLLRLADAQLRYSSEKCASIFHDLEKWCGVPIPRLESWALDVCEMLLDYGLEPAMLASWYELWVSELVRTQPRLQMTNLNGWINLGHCIPSGEKIQEILKKRLAERQIATDDPIKLLPEGYIIGIYSLLEPAAQRAREQLLARNPGLKIRICTDKVLTELAKSIAQQSDMVVIVITALKHAVTDGIAPFIGHTNIVRPQSSGTTNLVRAVEEFAAKYFL